MTEIKTHSLVLYKDHPALVKQMGDKLEIVTSAGKTVKVRPKDVTLLHPGPLTALADLKTVSGEVETAWELLQDTPTDIAELAELIYDAYTPTTAWAAWEHVLEGLYFRGSPTDIVARTPAQVAQEQANRLAKIAAEQARHALLERLKQQEYLPEDTEALREIEELAYGLREKSRLAQDIGVEESPEKAHSFLLQLGYWDMNINPYPRRAGVEIDSPHVPLDPLPEETRRDLTHLAAYAIDDAGSTDADDALSLEGNRLWVHVADVAAMVPPDSLADMEARARGATLYLPERIITMLPPEAPDSLALGRTDISPALSFGLDLDEHGEIIHVEVVPSWVRVTNCTYHEIDERIAEEPFSTFYVIAKRNEARRIANGAVQLDLPEVKVRVNEEGQVIISPLPNLTSRLFVTEAMLMTGEATAKFALEHAIPLAFSTQPPPDREPDFNEGLAGMFALRRTMNRSEMKSQPAPHSGLGLSAYVQATSPLRRYLDLVVHQQLRAFLRGEPMLDGAALLERVGAAAAVSGSVRRAERQSRQHWTHIYLKQNPTWQGVAVIVDKRDLRARILIPSLDLESFYHMDEDLPLNTELFMRIKKVRLPYLQCRFSQVKDDGDATMEEESL